MLKKIGLYITLIATVLLFTSFSFASNLGNDIKDSMDKTGNTIQNVMNGVTDAGKNAVDNMGNAVNDAANGARDTMNNMANGINNMTDDMFDNRDDNNQNNNENNNANTGNGADDGYSAARIATFTDTTTNNTWLWIALGVVALAIVGLSWYYMSDNRNNHHE